MITADGKKLGARGRGHDEQCTVEKNLGARGRGHEEQCTVKKNKVRGRGHDEQYNVYKKNFGHVGGVMMNNAL